MPMRPPTRFSQVLSLLPEVEYPRAREHNDVRLGIVPGFCIFHRKLERCGHGVMKIEQRWAVVAAAPRNPCSKTPQVAKI